MPGPKDLYGLTQRSFRELLRVYRRVRKIDEQLSALLRRWQKGSQKKARPLAFAKTRNGGEYPADLAEPGWLVYDIEFVSRTFAETAGEATPTDAVWTSRFRKAMTLKKTKGFPEGTLCAVYRIGTRLYIEPIEEPEDRCLIPVFWSDVPGWTASARQALMHAPDACPAWVTVAECEEA